MPKIMKRISKDWCHICGDRTVNLADVVYSHNAEHDPHSEDQCLRMCDQCGLRVVEAALLNKVAESSTRFDEKPGKVNSRSASAVC